MWEVVISYSINKKNPSHTYFFLCGLVYQSAFSLLVK